jgi:hypothetical protein
MLKTLAKAAYLGAIIATLINLALLNTIALGVYSTISFNTYPLLNSTILNNRAALYLVNSKSMLVDSLYKKSTCLQTIKAGT